MSAGLSGGGSGGAPLRAEADPAVVWYAQFRKLPFRPESNSGGGGGGKSEGGKSTTGGKSEGRIKAMSVVGGYIEY